MALTENEKKLGPLTKKPKKKLTMKERQPIRFGKGIFDGQSNQPDRMFRKQRKKSAVSGQMKGAPINTTGAPKYTTVNKPKQAGDIKKGVKVYKSNGNAVPGDRAVKKKAPITPSLISKNTPSSINRMDKTKSKKTKVVTELKRKN